MVLVCTLAVHLAGTRDVGAATFPGRDTATQATVTIVPDATGGEYDLVLVAVRNDELAAAAGRLAGLTASPAVAPPSPRHSRLCAEMAWPGCHVTWPFCTTRS
jgi:hypothetical protein